MGLGFRGEGLGSIYPRGSIELGPPKASSRFFFWGLMFIQVVYMGPKP